MNDLATIPQESLPSLVRRASEALASATTAAEVLDARDLARAGYDAAKSAGRILVARQAHDDVIAAVYRAQADALEIEAMAKRRLADEYDAARERGEVAGVGKPVIVLDGNNKATIPDLGLTRKDIHEARQLRDAERDQPGIIHNSIYDRLKAGHEPTKAALRGAISEAAMRGLKGAPQPRAANPQHQSDPCFEAMAAVSGACNSIAEKVATLGCDFILKGFLDASMRARNLNTFRAGRDALNRLLEAADAE